MSDLALGADIACPVVACTPDNPCHIGEYVCSASGSFCRDTVTPVKDGTLCGTNMICMLGACGPCPPGGSCTPMNPCHKGQWSCSIGMATCNDAHVNLSDGSVCGTDMVCSNGSCVPCKAGASCTPAKVCNLGLISCGTGMPVCGDIGTVAPDGTMCGSNMVCQQGSCAASATNLLKKDDSDFESSVGTWSAPGGSATLSVDNAHVLHGAGALKVVINGAPSIRSGAYAISPGATYTASAYLYTTQSPRNGAVTLYWLDGTGTVIGSDTGGPILMTQNGWTRISATLIAPGNAARVYLSLADTGGAGELYWVDEAMLNAGGLVAWQAGN